MPYRDEQEVLEARRRDVARRIEWLRERSSELREIATESAELEAELHTLEQKIAHTARRKTLPLLEDLRVASPCNASWDAMVGDDRVRFCGACQKNVFNLSAMHRDEAASLVASAEGRMCVRFFRRADGTVMTSDCSVGVSRKRRRRVVAAAGATALAALAGSAWMPGRSVPTSEPLRTDLVESRASEMGQLVRPELNPNPTPAPSPSGREQPRGEMVMGDIGPDPLIIDTQPATHTRARPSAPGAPAHARPPRR